MPTLADYISTYNQLKTSLTTVRQNITNNKADIQNLLNTYFNNVDYTLEYITSESVIIYLETFDTSLIPVFNSLAEDDIDFVVDSAEKYGEVVYSIELIPATD